MKGFREQIGASAVSGYDDDVNWIESAAFELMYLHELQYHRKKPLTPDVAMDAKKNLDEMPYSVMAKHLGFCMDVAPL